MPGVRASTIGSPLLHDLRPDLAEPRTGPLKPVQCWVLLKNQIKLDQGKPTVSCTVFFRDSWDPGHVLCLSQNR